MDVHSLKSSQKPCIIIFLFSISYFIERGKREQDNLLSAETVDGGRPGEADAELSDKRVIREIQGKYLVALELKYRTRCYEKYTSPQRHGRKATQEKEEEKHSSKYGLPDEPSFTIFCEQFIRFNITQDNEIFYMKNVKDTLVEMIQKTSI